MIEKNIYFYWGNEKMSFMRYMTLKSCRHYHPDWNIYLITRKDKTTIINNKYKENQQDNTYFDGDDYSQKLKELNLIYETVEDDYPEIGALNLEDHQNDDILGWYILGYKSGFKCDMDVLFIKPIPIDIFNNCSNYHAPKLFFYYGNMAIGFLYSFENENISYIYKDLYQLSLSMVSKPINHDDYQKVGGTLLYYYIRSKKINWFPISNNYVYPYVDNTPIWRDQLNKPYDQECYHKPPEECFAMHWYGGWPTSMEFNKLLTENNYQKYPCTLTYYIHEVLK